jgi:hypothetical protein
MVPRCQVEGWECAVVEVEVHVADVAGCGVAAGAA